MLNLTKISVFLAVFFPLGAAHGQVLNRAAGLPNESLEAFRSAVQRGDVSATVHRMASDWDAGRVKEGITVDEAAGILAEYALSPADTPERVQALSSLADLAHVEGRTSEIAEGVAVSLLARMGQGPYSSAGRILARLPDNRGIPRLIALLEHPALCRIGLGSLMEWAGPAGHAALRAFDPARIPNEDMRQALVEFQRRPGG